MVESETISDEEAVWLSKDIAKRIENELQYPGQIKVTVIRETTGGGLRPVVMLRIARRLFLQPRYAGG